MSNIRNSVYLPELKADEIVYGILAIADVMLSIDEQEEGCLLVNIDTQLIDIIVYFKGHVKYIRVLDVRLPATILETLKKEMDFLEYSNIFFPGHDLPPYYVPVIS
jgi:hypothetical protein